MEPSTVFITMFSILLVLIFLRIPIAFALAFAVIPILLLTPQVTPVMLLQRMMVQYGSFILLSVPFFVLAANLMNFAGITDQLLRLARSMVGHLPGGLAHVNVVTSMIFAGISGSSNADAAGEGSIIIPAMLKEGYDKNFSVAITACSAVMGVIIPPSIIMVVWGGTMNVSVSGLFLAGIIPGIMIGVFQMILVHFYAKKRNFPRTSRFSFREVLQSFKESGAALLTPLIIVGGIVFGIVTPTEASAIAVLYALGIGVFLYRSVTWKSFIHAMTDSLKLSSIVLFAVGTAAIYAWVLAYYHIPQYLVEVMGGLTDSPVVMLLLIVLAFLAVGMFIDAVPAIVIFGPILQPVAVSVGVHPLHFAIVGCIALAYGLITPPYGLCLLITSEIAGINCMTPLKEVGTFLGAMLLVLILIIVIPDLTLGIPRLVMPSAF